MLQLREVLKDLVANEFDPLYKDAPPDGHAVEILTAIQHGRIVSCTRRECITNPENIEIGEKIREWGREITATPTVTYAILDRCFSHLPIDTWVDLESMSNILGREYDNSALCNALERLVKITHHKLYKFDFIVESDGGNRYKIVRREAEVKTCEEDAPNEESKEKHGKNTGDFSENLSGKTAHGDDKVACNVDFLDKMFGYRILSDEKQNELLIAAQSGDVKKSKKAIDTLVRTNFRLVAWHVKRLGITQRDAIYDEVVQEGLLGLNHAIKKMEVGRVKFLTYAGWWVRSYIQRCLRRNKYVVSMPYYKIELLARIKRTMKEAAERGKVLSLEDMANMLGVRVKTIESIFEIDDIAEFSTSDVMDDGDDVHTPSNHDLERIMMEEGLDDLGREEAEMGAMTIFEAERLIEVLKIVKRMVDNKSVSGSKLSRDVLHNRSMYILFRRMELYDMPWADATVQDVADECGMNKQRVDQVVKDTMIPLVKKAMRMHEYSEDQVQDYGKLFDLWIKSNKKMAESKRLAIQMKKAQLENASNPDGGDAPDEDEQKLIDMFLKKDGTEYGAIN